MSKVLTTSFCPVVLPVKYRMRSHKPSLNRSRAKERAVPVLPKPVGASNKVTGTVAKDCSKAAWASACPSRKVSKGLLNERVERHCRLSRRSSRNSSNDSTCFSKASSSQCSTGNVWINPPLETSANLNSPTTCFWAYSGKRRNSSR